MNTQSPKTRVNKPNISVVCSGSASSSTENRDSLPFGWGDGEPPTPEEKTTEKPKTSFSIKNILSGSLSLKRVF